MNEEVNPIKEFLFEYITNSDKKIKKLTSQSKFTEIIEDVLENCYDKVITMGEKEESIGTLATGMLHYILTNALVPSQRKVEFREIQIDIVIPDLKMLQKDSNKTLIICIPKTLDKMQIQKKWKNLKKSNQIWIMYG